MTGLPCKSDFAEFLKQLSEFRIIVVFLLIKGNEEKKNELSIVKGEALFSMGTSKRPEYDMHILGHNLKKLREKNGYSVSEIKDYLGVSSVQSVYQYENGIAMPRADALLALMELYGVSAEQLRTPMEEV